MMRRVHLTACVSLLLAASLAPAQACADEWVSYRNAYRAMVVFEKYGGDKNLIQHHLQVAPRDPAVAGPPQLTLLGKSTRVNLPLDPLGRTAFPLLKAAYDDNAVLVVDGKAADYAVRPRVSITLRNDGNYDAAQLRAACEQALGYIRYIDASARDRQCTGVRFVFPAKPAGQAKVRLRGQGAEQLLPVVEGAAFPGDAVKSFPTATYRFGGTPAQVLTSDVPLAIVPLIE